MHGHSRKCWSAAHSCRAPPWGIQLPTCTPGRRNHLPMGCCKRDPQTRNLSPSSRQKPVLRSRGDLEVTPGQACVTCSLFPLHTPATQHRVNLCKRGVTLRDGVTVRT